MGWLSQHDRLRLLPPALQLKRLPPGGVVSLLYHFGACLRDIKAILTEMDEAQTKWSSMFGFAYPLAILALLILLYKGRLLRRSSRGRTTLVTAVLSILLYRHVRVNTAGVRRLRQVHAHLLILLRIWMVVCDSFVTTEMRKEKSYNLLVSAASEGDYKDELKYGGRLILEHLSLPRESPMWYQRSRGLRLLKYFLDVVYAGLYVGYSMRGRAWTKPLEWPVNLGALMYYAMQPKLAGEAAAAFFADKETDVLFVKRVWNLLDHPVSRALTRVLAPSLSVNQSVTIAGVCCHVWSGAPLDLELLTAHLPPAQDVSHCAAIKQSNCISGPSAALSPAAGMYVRGSSFDAHSGSTADSLAMSPDNGSSSPPLNFSALSPVRSQQPQSSIPRVLSASGAFAVPLSARPPARGPSVPNFSTDDEACDTAVYGGTAHAVAGGDPAGPAVLLYIHGGGFVSSSFANDAVSLSRWAAQESAIIVYVHYSLSPEARYPVALNECVAVYQHVRRIASRVVIFGESAGGNLAAALMLRIIAAKLPTPEAIVLGYPALNLNKSTSPSRGLHFNDPLVPGNMLANLARQYIPVEQLDKPSTDPFLHPSLAPDAMLAMFPHTSIMVGGLDPLLDDAIDFNTRLRRHGVPGDLRVYRGLPHGFFAFNRLPEAQNAVRCARDLCFQNLREKASNE